MISGKLVHLIETHWDEVMTRVIDQIHREPQMSHMRGLVEGELARVGAVPASELGPLALRRK